MGLGPVRRRPKNVKVAQNGREAVELPSEVLRLVDEYRRGARLNREIAIAKLLKNGLEHDALLKESQTMRERLHRLEEESVQRAKHYAQIESEYVGLKFMAFEYFEDNRVLAMKLGMESKTDSDEALFNRYLFLKNVRDQKANAVRDRDTADGGAGISSGSRRRR